MAKHNSLCWCSGKTTHTVRAIHQSFTSTTTVLLYDVATIIAEKGPSHTMHVKQYIASRAALVGATGNPDSHSKGTTSLPSIPGELYPHVHQS